MMLRFIPNENEVDEKATPQDKKDLNWNPSQECLVLPKLIKFYFRYELLDIVAEQ